MVAADGTVAVMFVRPETTRRWELGFSSMFRTEIPQTWPQYLNKSPEGWMKRCDGNLQNWKRNKSPNKGRQIQSVVSAGDVYIVMELGWKRIGASRSHLRQSVVEL